MAISKSYKNNNVLQELIISWQNSKITVNTVDRVCDLSIKNIGNTGAVMLSNLIYCTASIRNLVISKNKLFGNALIVIFGCVKNNAALQQLHFSHNQIGIKGAYKCAEVIEINTTLQMLDISHCGIPYARVVIIIDVLKCNKSQIF